jgi:hypothetical protein
MALCVCVLYLLSVVMIHEPGFGLILRLSFSLAASAIDDGEIS